MSAELLRRAAEALRTAATEAQHSEPWCPDLMWSGIRHLMRNCDLEYECMTHGERDGVRDCGGPDMYDGRYIALMHPPVALALAGLLEDVAESVEQDGGIMQDSTTVGAVAVARAILREAP